MTNKFCHHRQTQDPLHEELRCPRVPMGCSNPFHGDNLSNRRDWQQHPCGSRAWATACRTSSLLWLQQSPGSQQAWWDSSCEEHDGYSQRHLHHRWCTQTHTTSDREFRPRKWLSWNTGHRSDRCRRPEGTFHAPSFSVQLRAIDRSWSRHRSSGVRHRRTLPGCAIPHFPDCTCKGWVQRKSFSCLPVIIRLIVVIRVEIVENENLSVLLQSLGNPFDRLPVVIRSSVKEAFCILLDELLKRYVHHRRFLMKANIRSGLGLALVLRRTLFTQTTMFLRAESNSAVLLKLAVNPYCFTNSVVGMFSTALPFRTNRRVAPMIWRILWS